METPSSDKNFVVRVLLGVVWFVIFYISVIIDIIISIIMYVAQLIASGTNEERLLIRSSIPTGYMVNGYKQFDFPTFPVQDVQMAIRVPENAANNSDSSSDSEEDPESLCDCGINIHGDSDDFDIPMIHTREEHIQVMEEIHQEVADAFSRGLVQNLVCNCSRRCHCNGFSDEDADDESSDSEMPDELNGHRPAPRIGNCSKPCHCYRTLPMSPRIGEPRGPSVFDNIISPDRSSDSSDDSDDSVNLDTDTARVNGLTNCIKTLRKCFLKAHGNQADRYLVEVLQSFYDPASRYGVIAVELAITYKKLITLAMKLSGFFARTIHDIGRHTEECLRAFRKFILTFNLLTRIPENYNPAISQEIAEIFDDTLRTTNVLTLCNSMNINFAELAGYCTELNSILRLVASDIYHRRIPEREYPEVCQMLVPIITFLDASLQFTQICLLLLGLTPMGINQTRENEESDNDTDDSSHENQSSEAYNGNLDPNGSDDKNESNEISGNQISDDESTEVEDNLAEKSDEFEFNYDSEDSDTLYESELSDVTYEDQETELPIVSDNERAIIIPEDSGPSSKIENQ